MGPLHIALAALCALAAGGFLIRVVVATIAHGVDRREEWHQLIYALDDFVGMMLFFAIVVWAILFTFPV